MWRVDGFKTKEEAKAFAKENGGMVLWYKLTPKQGRETAMAKDYRIATQATGIDREKYPYVVERLIK